MKARNILKKLVAFLLIGLVVLALVSDAAPAKGKSK